MNSKPNILVVDDTTASLALMVKVLTNAGYKVRPADSGELALVAVAAQSPELILLDIRMKGIDGLEVCRRLKANSETHDIPIILLSAVADTNEWVAGFKLGASDYINKPFQIEELLARVKMQLDLGHVARELREQAGTLQKTNELLRNEVAARLRKEEELKESLLLAENTKKELLYAIEEQKRIEAVLRESDEKFRNVFDNSSVGKSITMIDGRVNTNAAFCEMVGYGAEALSRLTWQDISHPDDICLTKKYIEDLKNGTIKCARFEKRYIKKDGSVLWADVHTVLQRDENGNPKFFITAVVDISERKKAEFAAEERTRFADALMEATALSTWVSDEFGTAIKANRACLLFFGATEDEVIGKYNVFKDEVVEAQGLMPLLRHAYTSGEPVKFFLDYNFKMVEHAPVQNATHRFIQVNLTPIKDVAGKVINVVSQSIDLTEVRRNEEKLRENEEKFRAIFENNASALAIIDPDTTILMVNKEYCNISKYTAEEVVGMSWTQQILPEDLERLMEYNRMRLINPDKVPGHYEFSFFRKDGEIRNCLMSVALLQTSRQIICSFVDITTRIRMENILKESEVKFATAFQSSHYAIIITSMPDGRVVELNESTLRITGYKRDEMLGSAIPDLNLWAFDSDREEVLRDLSAGMSVAGREYVFRKKNGDTLTGFFSAGIIIVGGAPHVLSSIEDITDQIASRKKLDITLKMALKGEKENAALLKGTRAILVGGEFSIVAHQLFDICRDIINATSGYVALLTPDGQENEVLFLEAGNLPCTVDPKLPMPIRGLREIAYATGKPVYENDFSKSEWVQWMPKGHVNLLNVMFVPLVIEGKTIGLIGLANKKEGFSDDDKRIGNAFGELAAIALRNSRDHQLLKESEERLRQSQKMEAIGQLAGGIAHDFNNILGGITGYADLLRLKYFNDTEIKGCADKMLQSAQKAASLTRQLLTFARKAHIQKSYCDIHTLINSTIEMFKRIVDKKITVETGLAASPSVIFIDQNMFESSLLNLCINARDAMPEGGTLRITTRLQLLDETSLATTSFNCMAGRYLQINVSDTGIGMDSAICTKIFEPFFTTKEVGKGTGLGLASVYGFVKQHEGAIIVESLVGKGTTFSLYFPMVENNVVLPRELPDDDGELLRGTGHILVIDDEENIREILSKLLEACGYKVTVCCNGGEALDYFSEHFRELDAVFLDLIMPSLSGMECFSKMVEIDPDVRVIAISGFSGDSQSALLEKCGIKDFVQKPFDRKTLLQSLQRVLVSPV